MPITTTAYRRKGPTRLALSRLLVSCCTLILLFAIVNAFDVVTYANAFSKVADEAKKKAATSRRPPAPTAATDAQKEVLPDPTDPKARKSLTCSACRATAKHLFSEARRMDDKRGGQGQRRLSDMDWVEVFDGACATIAKRNGLLMINNTATTTYSDVSLISVMTGAWIASFIEDKCAEWVEVVEDKIKKHYLSLGSFAQMQSLMCGYGDGKQMGNPWIRKACTSSDDIDYHEANIAPFLNDDGTVKTLKEVLAEKKENGEDVAKVATGGGGQTKEKASAGVAESKKREEKGPADEDAPKATSSKRGNKKKKDTKKQKKNREDVHHEDVHHEDEGKHTPNKSSEPAAAAPQDSSSEVETKEEHNNDKEQLEAGSSTKAEQVDSASGEKLADPQRTKNVMRKRMAEAKSRAEAIIGKGKEEKGGQKKKQRKSVRDLKKKRKAKSDKKKSNGDQDE